MYGTEYNAIFGQELESFSQKSGILQSGCNTMQTTFVLERDFGSVGSNIVNYPCAPAYTTQAPAPGAPAAVAAVTEAVSTYVLADIFELRAYCMFDKVIAFDETSGSIRSEY